MSSVATLFWGWAGPVTDVARLWDRKPDIFPRLNIDMEVREDARDCLYEIIGELSFPRLQALIVSGPTRSNKPWSDMFRSAPNVALLRATGRARFLLGTCLGRPGAPATARESNGKDGARDTCHGDALEKAVVMPGCGRSSLGTCSFPLPVR